MDASALVDKLYRRGIGLDEDRDMLQTIVENRFDRPVDWDAHDPNSRNSDVLTHLAFQYHYAHMTEFVLAGRIIEHGPQMPAKRTGMMLAMSSLSYIDMWGRYLSRHGERDAVNDWLEAYFSDLMQEQNVIKLLIGMSIIGSITGRVLMQHTDESADILYNTLASHVAAAKHEDERMVSRYLQRELSEQDDVPWDDLADAAKNYRKEAVAVIEDGTTPYYKIGVDETRILQGIRSETAYFFQDIGLPDIQDTN